MSKTSKGMSKVSKTSGGGRRGAGATAPAPVGPRRGCWDVAAPGDPGEAGGEARCRRSPSPEPSSGHQGVGGGRPSSVGGHEKRYHALSTAYGGRLRRALAAGRPAGSRTAASGWCASAQPCARLGSRRTDVLGCTVRGTSAGAARARTAGRCGGLEAVAARTASTQRTTRRTGSPWDAARSGRPGERAARRRDAAGTMLLATGGRSLCACVRVCGACRREVSARVRRVCDGTSPSHVCVVGASHGARYKYRCVCVVLFRAAETACTSLGRCATDRATPRLQPRQPASGAPSWATARGRHFPQPFFPLRPAPPVGFATRLRRRPPPRGRRRCTKRGCWVLLEIPRLLVQRPRKRQAPRRRRAGTTLIETFRPGAARASARCAPPPPPPPGMPHSPHSLPCPARRIERRPP